MDVPRAFWGVVSVGNPLRPIEPIVESLAEAERLMNSQGRYSVRVRLNVCRQSATTT